MALIKQDRPDGSSTLPSASWNYRIEAYDIAHLHGMETVGVFVVSLEGRLTPAEYRKFKIHKDKNNDIFNLGEILNRRLNHSEWAYPDLIVVDGNEVHVKLAESILQARRIMIPVVSVVKNAEHKAKRLIGHPEIIEKYKKEIIAVNAEAHRFAITYHRKRRNKNWNSM
jgi:excinuclease ABC subunit C